MSPSAAHLDNFGAEPFELSTRHLEAHAGDDDLEAGLEQLLSGILHHEPAGEVPQEPLIVGARSFEFVCRGCFLIFHRRQMADPVLRLCADCAEFSVQGTAA